MYTYYSSTTVILIACSANTLLMYCTVLSHYLITTNFRNFFLYYWIGVLGLDRTRELGVYNYITSKVHAQHL